MDDTDDTDLFLGNFIYVDCVCCIYVVVTMERFKRVG